MMLMMAHTDRRNVVNRLPDYICYGILLALWTVTTDAQNAKIQVPLGTYAVCRQRRGVSSGSVTITT